MSTESHRATTTAPARILTITAESAHSGVSPC